MIRWLSGLVLAAIVSYYTTMATLQTQVAIVQSREQAHFEELQRSLTDIKAELWELRRMGARLENNQR